MVVLPAVGRFRVERRLGAGGFATVWLAHDPELDVAVAVKVLAENWATHADVRRRFVDEARMLRRVDSDHLVRVYDIGELDDGRPYLVMTYADGGSLAERVERYPAPWAVPYVLSMVDAVAAGLAVLHGHGIVHRDVKPSNVLLRSARDGTEQVLVGDLGLAKDLDLASGLTLPAGSSQYAPPEQRSGLQQVGPASDVYALAVTAAELLGLARPWPDTPVGIVLTRATWPDPGRRTPGVLDLAAELRGVLAPPAPPAVAVPPAPVEAAGGARAVDGATAPGTSPASAWLVAGRRRLAGHRRSVAGAVVVVVAGILGAVAWWSSSDGRTLTAAAGKVSLQVPGTLGADVATAFPGEGDTSSGVRASQGSRSVAVAFSDAGTDPAAVTLPIPGRCAAAVSRPVTVGSWNGVVVHHPGCPDRAAVDEVALAPGSGSWTVWLEVRSVDGEPDLTRLLTSLDVQP